MHLVLAGCLKGIFKMPKLGFAGLLVEGDFDHVESSGCFQQPMSLQIDQRGPRHFELLVVIYRIGGATRVEPISGPRLHLDKDDLSLFPNCDQVDFADPSIEGMLEDFVTAPFQVDADQAFSIVARRFFDLLQRIRTP